MVEDTKYNHRECIRLSSGEYYLVSRVELPGAYDEWETMIFPADDKGEVTSWLEEYSYRGYESIIDTVIKFTEKRGLELSDVEGDLD